MSNSVDKKVLVKQSELPVKILQFGEGNFLRAFIGEVVHQLNQKAQYNGGIAVIQPIEQGMVSQLESQGGAYTLFLNGLQNTKQIQEKKLIHTIVKTNNPYVDFAAFLELGKLPDLEFIFSNTTEAGIQFVASDQFSDRPPSSFPAKLTRLLWERFTHFNGSDASGLHILPCELINYNADTLKKTVLDYAHLWNLGASFIQWIETANTFCNTLVDQIVPGYPRENLAFYEDQLDYKDTLLVTAEPFFLWVIEGNDQLKSKLHLDQIDLDIKVVDDLQPFRTQKVRILNGAHTSTVPFALLYGHHTVSDLFKSEFTQHFLEQTVRNEIAPTLAMDQTVLKQFTEAVFDRFKNPFINHYLASIALNSIAKFKVRVLPSLLSFFEKTNTLPPNLVFSFACLIKFYQGEWKGKQLPVQDDANVVMKYKNFWKIESTGERVKEILTDLASWDQNLNEIPKLADQLTAILNDFEQNDIESSYYKHLKNQ